MTVCDVCADLVRHPVHRVLYRWHWKSATLSAIFRGSLFFATNVIDGVGAASRATVVEFVLCVPLVGVLAAVTQAFGRAEPAWAASLTAMALVPALAHGAEFVVHWAVRTPELERSIEASITLSVVSTVFNLFAMRRGVLIVVGGSQPFGADLRLLPRLVIDFVLAMPRALLRMRR